eukprot:scaffold7_cov414-Pavlova_lutheri.AAC.28
MQYHNWTRTVCLVRKSATLMASANTYSDRNKSMWVHDIHQAMKLRPMTLDEKAKLVGIPSASLVMGNEQQKQRFLGNAVPVPFLQLLLKHFIPKWVFQRGPTTIQFHTNTTQPSTRADDVCKSVQLVHTIDSYVVLDELHQRLLQAAAEDDSSGLQSVEGRIPVPNDADLRKYLMHIHHDLPTARHPGQKRMVELMKRPYMWPGMSRDIVQYVENRRACQLAKPSHKRKSHLLQRMPSPTGPFTYVYCDLTTGLPLTTTGYDSVFVIVDKFTKMTIYIPTVKAATASMLVQLFLRHVVCHYGAPEKIFTDHDSRFVGEIWNDFGSMLGTKLHRSTPYHPQSDGQTERQNQTLKAALRTMMTHPTDWDSLLPMIQFAHNNAVTSSTKYSPFYLHLSRSPRLPTLVTALQTVSTRGEHDEEDLANRYHEVFENMDAQQLVKLRRLGRLAKYATQSCGPFKILAIQPTGAIKLDLPAGTQEASADHDDALLSPDTQNHVVDQYVLRDSNTIPPRYWRAGKTRNISMDQYHNSTLLEVQLHNNDMNIMNKYHITNTSPIISIFHRSTTLGLRNIQ